MPLLFRTELNIPPAKTLKDLNHKWAFIGSCFATEIQALMQSGKAYAKFSDFGVLFNPVSIADTFKKEEFWSNGFCFREERYFNFHTSSKLSAKEKPDLQNRLELAHRNWLNTIEEAQTLVVTLGTAWVYKLKTSGSIVANCQKIPQKEFTKVLLSLNEIESALENILSAIPKETEVIFTLSPVRHLKDGFSENSLSKALLRVAIDQITVKHPNRCFYFPAFELLMDDLRDYRFYKDDLLHPSEAAVNYIFEKFLIWQFKKEAIESIKLNHKAVLQTLHRPIAED